MHETLIKRTIWTAKCEHDKSVKTENPPRERYCAQCAKWIPYIEESYIGPSLSQGRKPNEERRMQEYLVKQKIEG